MGWRQFAVWGVTGLLAACGGETPVLGVIGSGGSANGGVAADEPTAAVVARDILAGGGTAADAAVAGYFALSVTYPVSAGLGAGGACAVFDAKAGDVKVIDFPARLSSSSDRAGRSATVPGGPRGMLALHARFGRLRVEQLVQPAERLARFGHRISRALAVEIADQSDRLRADPGARKRFFRANGSPIAEGEAVVQPELAAILAAIRARGVGEFYSGDLANRYVDAVRDLGVNLDPAAMRAYRPEWAADAAKRTVGNNEAHFYQPDKSSLAVRVWDALGEQDAYTLFDDSPDTIKNSTVLQPFKKGQSAPRSEMADLPQAVSDAAARSSSTTSGSSDSDFGRGSTSLAAVDRDGGMVACAFTMGAPFGTARMIPGTGILQGDADAAGASPLAIMMLINRPTKTARMTAVAAHGPAAGGALALVALRVLDGNQLLSKAIGMPRAVPSPSHGTIFVDDDGGALIERLKSVGLTAERAGTLGLINLVACPTASRRGPQVCDVRADPRGHGISASVE